jgi:hypothetical protein
MCKVLSPLWRQLSRGCLSQPGFVCVPVLSTAPVRKVFPDNEPMGSSAHHFSSCTGPNANMYLQKIGPG